MAYSLATAVKNALSYSYYPTGMCLSFVRKCQGVPAKYGDAATAYWNTKYRHTTTPPAGYPVWWTGGSRGYGHVAVSLGGGKIRSTDWPSGGRVGTTTISYLTSRWGQRYRGWSEDINGVRLSGAVAPTLPAVDLSRVVYAARTEPQASGTPKSYATGVILVEKALYREGYTSIPVDGHYGTVTKTAYARWQYRLGYRGSDANGIPGAASLAALGRKSGLFRVVA